MKNINFSTLVVASSLLVGCGQKNPEVQVNEMAAQKVRIELAHQLQEQVGKNTAQILCGKYAGQYTYPSQIIIASDGVYRLDVPSEWEVTAEKNLNASDIYWTSNDKLVAAKVIRNQECGLKF